MQGQLGSSRRYQGFAKSLALIGLGRESECSTPWLGLFLADEFAENRNR